MAIGPNTSTTGIRPMPWNSSSTKVSAANPKASGSRQYTCRILKPIDRAMPAAAATTPVSTRSTAGAVWNWKYTTPISIKRLKGTSKIPPTAATAPAKARN